MIPSIPSLETVHFPVMINEVIQTCQPIDGSLFVDCTFGGGGYTKEFLKFPAQKSLHLIETKVLKQEQK